VDELKNRIRRFLATHMTMTLATVGEDGRPQAAALFFAETEALSLVFISEPKTRHSQNVARDGRVAATIYAEGQQWQTIKGLQVEGVCWALSGQEAKAARAVYLAKYPFIEENKLLAAMLHLVTFYQVSPAWLRLIDNSQGFGYKEELRLP
jgi:uncharacterized protein YhbP (UPF0306 family)